MKKTVAVMFFCGLVAAAQGSGFRVFTDDQGRTIEAKIVSFDSLTGKIELERKDGVRATVEPGLFSEEDQAYVSAWADAFRILSDDNLQISFDKRTVDSFKEGMTDEQPGDEGVEGEIICHEITLKNRSKSPIENLKIDYKYFIHVTGKDIPEDTLKEVEIGTYTVERIPPGERVTFKTADTRLEQKFAKTKVYQAGGSNQFLGYEYNKTSEDDLMGIWLKIYGPPVEGEPSIRDVTDPEDLPEDVNWAE